MSACGAPEVGERVGHFVLEIPPDAAWRRASMEDTESGMEDTAFWFVNALNREPMLAAIVGQ